MENILQPPPTQGMYPDPIKITKPESWQWEVLAKAFLNDPLLRFWIGDKMNEGVLKDYFEAHIKLVLSTDGAVFSSPDRRAIITWIWLGHDANTPNEWKKRWHEVLGPEGVKRYNWLFEAGDLQIDSSRRDKCMYPDYVGALPGSQGYGYGGHICRWTLNYFDDLGYETPYLLASTSRNAKFHGSNLGYHVHREVDYGGSDFAVFMKRNQPV